MELLQLIITILTSGLVLWLTFFKDYLHSYSKEKGKNLATKEDIEEIQEKIEEVRKNTEISLSQYNLMNPLQYNIIEEFLGLEFHLTDLMALKGETDTDALLSQLTNEDKQEINTRINKINIILDKMFLVLKDSDYQGIRDGMSLAPTAIRDTYEKLLISMRRAQYPDTIFNDRTSLRYFHRLPLL